MEQDSLRGAYPDAIFPPVPSRCTRVARSLAHEVLGLGTTARGIACAGGRRLDDGHPDRRFHDGHDDALPALGCDRATGSCIDLNLRFMAALRAAGIVTGYVAGAFFPAEKGDWCSDMPCRVITRTADGIQQWGIAHHLKMGSPGISPGLNPKPGFCAALSHGVVLRTPIGGEVLGGIKGKRGEEEAARDGGLAAGFHLGPGHGDGHKAGEAPLSGGAAVTVQPGQVMAHPVAAVPDAPMIGIGGLEGDEAALSGGVKEQGHLLGQAVPVVLGR